MHEKIRIASGRMPCDLCGQMIFPGEQYRIVRDEYGSMTFFEHITCPGSPAVTITDPRPPGTTGSGILVQDRKKILPSLKTNTPKPTFGPPKVRTNFNHAHCMA